MMFPYPPNCSTTNCLDITKTANLLRTSIGSLSLIVELFFLFSIFYMKLQQNRVYKAMIPLVVADILQSSHDAISALTFYVHLSYDYCIVYAFALEFTHLSASFWQAAITTWYSWLIFRDGDFPPYWFENGCHVIWVIAAFLGSIGLFFENDFYEPVSDSAWCWISPHYPLARFILFFLWIYLVIFYLVTISVLVVIYIIKRTSHLRTVINTKTKIKYFTSTLGFPIIYGLLWAPITVARTCMLFNVEVPLKVILYSPVILSFCGLLNVVYYGSTRKMWKKFKNTCLALGDEELHYLN